MFSEEVPENKLPIVVIPLAWYVPSVYSADKQGSSQSGISEQSHSHDVYVDGKLNVDISDNE